MTVSVVVPFRPTDDPDRTKAMAWVVNRLGAHFPSTEIVVESDGSDDGPFNRARAVNRGVAQTTGDVLVLSDADVVGEAEALYLAVLTVGVEAYHSAWAIPYDRYVHLNPLATDRVLRLPPSAEVGFAEADVGDVYDERTRPVRRFGGSVCGLVVITREAFDEVGGYDENFVGWGWEDTAFAATVWGLVGPPERVHATCAHLWHALDPGRYRNNPNRALGSLYLEAFDKGNAKMLRRLIAQR